MNTPEVLAAIDCRTHKQRQIRVIHDAAVRQKCQKRPTHIETDLYKSKEPLFPLRLIRHTIRLIHDAAVRQKCQKRPTHIKRDLHTLKETHKRD